MRYLTLLILIVISDTYGQSMNKVLDHVSDVLVQKQGPVLFLTDLGTLYGLDSMGKWRLREEKIQNLAPGAAVEEDGSIYSVEDFSLSRLPSQAYLASIGMDGIEFKVKKNGHAYFGDEALETNFKQVLAYHKDLAAGLSSFGEYYLKTEEGFQKFPQPVEFTHIALASDGTMAAVGFDQFIYIKLGGAHHKGSWQKTPQKAKKVYLASLHQTYILNHQKELFVSEDFMLVDYNFNEFQIKNVLTGLCLESTSDRKVQVQKCSDNQKQFWRRNDLNEGYVLENSFEKKCLFPFGESLGSPVGLWSCNDQAVITHKSGAGILDFPKGCIDIQNSKKEGQDLMLWKNCPEGEFQKWSFVNFRYEKP